MQSFRFFVYTPAGHDDPSLAIAASRAGGIGVLNAECFSDVRSVASALGRLAHHARNPYGIKLGCRLASGLTDRLLAQYSKGMHWLIVEPAVAAQNTEWIRNFRETGGQALVELTRW